MSSSVNDEVTDFEVRGFPENKKKYLNVLKIKHHCFFK